MLGLADVLTLKAIRILYIRLLIAPDIHRPPVPLFCILLDQVNRNRHNLRIGTICESVNRDA